MTVHRFHGLGNRAIRSLSTGLVLRIALDSIFVNILRPSQQRLALQSIILIFGRPLQSPGSACNFI